MGVTDMHITLIGYGEVGRILAEDLAAQGHALSACDRLAGSSAGVSMRGHAQRLGVRLGEDHAAAVRGAELVISAVTASQTVPVAQSSAEGLSTGAFFLDFNSASPLAKQQAARAVDAQGGRYVEGAVMTSVPPYRIRVPLLLGGPNARALEPVLAGLGFAARVADERLGVASATKMCRSVMIKGLEAMVIESFTAARHYGVEDAVIASLNETFPGLDWERQAAYFFQRVIEHGRRRSEEVREVAQTVREAGLESWSASGAAERQAWMADLADAQVFGVRGATGFARSSDWRTEADRILGHVGGPGAASKSDPTPVGDRPKARP
jgi:3-hydroxyisobutyrate dehydrogenase-like beta-hydroxyacid dehydrogenase